MSRLDWLLEQYLEVKKQEEEIAAKKEKLASEIKSYLENEPNMKYESANTRAALVEKVNFKYTDETAIFNYLNSNKLNDVYTIKKIDTTKFNKELKTKGILYNHLKNYITESVTTALNVSEVK